MDQHEIGARPIQRSLSKLAFLAAITGSLSVAVLGQVATAKWVPSSSPGSFAQVTATDSSDAEATARSAFSLSFGSPFAGASNAHSGDLAAVASTGTGSGSVVQLAVFPFTAKVRGRIGTYRLGYWPAEQGRLLSAAYENPSGFIEVTPANENLYVSEHFRLRDFLTHDQANVWPKYVVLREPLLDKLELVIADLGAHGVPVSRMRVMSGFRTPQYNIQGVGEGGRALNSRHQYGDAADVFVDNDGNDRMDDLNHDGKLSAADGRIIVNAVNRVEAANPELVGGAGLYASTACHGPFVHIDARGRKARWGGA